MTTIKQINELATDIYNHLHTVNVSNSNESRVVWNESTPEHLKDWMFNITSDNCDGSFAELDEYFTVLQSLAGIITDNTNDDELNNEYDNQFDESLYEYTWTYISNYYTIKWLLDDTSRTESVDEYLSNGVATNVISAIDMAISESRQEIAGTLMAAMVSKFNKDNE